PYVSLASSVSVKNQNAEEFKELMQKALEIDVDKDPSSRLLNILSQKQAKWMLEHMDNYFLLEKGESEE
ncbi:MAG: TRAP transporter TatT component family protein, partial [Spirochaetes bacterium]|nr:TRAP transporter TatT component family protein [Spirochaetota bacterium]